MKAHISKFICDMDKIVNADIVWCAESENDRDFTLSRSVFLQNVIFGFSLKTTGNFI